MLEFKFDESQVLKKISLSNLSPKISSNQNQKKSADTNKSTLNTGNKDSVNQMDNDKHISEEAAQVDITIANNDDEATENSEEEKVSQQQSIKVTYLCPVSDCVFVCETMEEKTAEQHLQSCHADSYFLGQKFIKL